MILARKEAVILSSFYKFLELSSRERDDLIECALSERDIETATPQLSNTYARKYIEYQFSFYLNSYLESFLSHRLEQTVNVKGKTQKLLPCFCCGYKTLEKRGEYFHCKVCFWEDDGGDDLHRHSGPNHMTLAQAKHNFKAMGAKSERVIQYLDKDRMLQHEKDIL